MKKIIFSLAILTGVMFTSCSSDDDSTTPEVSTTGNLTSLITGETKNLDAATKYTFSGPVLVPSGATLNIPAGTKIEAKAGGTGVYIAVLRGGKININGTESAPVEISSPNGAAGDWGGLVIAGNATTTNQPDDDGLVIAEIGGIEYGQSGNTTANDTESSGSITYLVVKGTGAAVNADSEYNGISFYAVGSGTKVENVAIIGGNDDGVEMFGGTVNLKNVYLEDLGDDAVDWTEGWSGTMTDTYILHNNEGFSTAFEGDKDNNNPKFVNVTAVSSKGGTALQFKKESGATITGLSLKGYDKNIDMKDNGSLSNVQIDGADADPAASYDAAATVDVKEFDWATK